jgi:2-polyprenyl-3-methyl-5-hydroxy-6-metoxy-1,4-benzoquinol methylase
LIRASGKKSVRSIRGLSPNPSTPYGASLKERSMPANEIATATAEAGIAAQEQQAAVVAEAVAARSDSLLDIPAEIHAAPLEVVFRDRQECVSCGAELFDEVWAGRFSEPRVRRYLAAFHYACDLDSALASGSFRLVRCRCCQMTFHQRVLTDDWLAILYRDWISAEQIELVEASVRGRDRARAAFERGRQMTKHVLRLDRLLRPTTRDLRLLDFGCGDGDFLSLASHFGFAVFGIDISETRTEPSRARRIPVVGDFDSLDALGVDHVDAAVLFETLEHVPDPKSLVHSIGQRLSSGGVLIVEVPNCQGITVPETMEEFHAVHPLEHINAFTPRTLRALCERAGFLAIDKPQAHVTTSRRDLARTEANSFLHLLSGAQYFRKV